MDTAAKTYDEKKAKLDNHNVFSSCDSAKA